MHTRSFQHEHFGAGAIVTGLREARANPGTAVVFESAEHPVRGGEVHSRVAIAFGHIDGKPTWRYAGDGDEFDAAGSHALIPTWYDDQSIEHAAAELVIALSRWPGACIFRVPATDAPRIAQQVAA